MLGTGVIYGGRCRLLRRAADRAGSASSVAMRSVATRALPSSHPGWRQAAEAHHAIVIGETAADQGMSVADYRQRLTTWLQVRVSLPEVRIRMRPHLFDRFLLDGRYKSEFELPNHSGGAKHRGLRMLLEHTVLAVPPDAADVDRPVYGYLAGSDEAHPWMQQYGPVVLILRPEVRGRCTFTIGDSLDLAVAPRFPDPCFVPVPLEKPGILAFPMMGKGPLASLMPTGPLHEASPHPYVEVQIFGGVRLADIRAVVFTMGYGPSISSLAALDRSGVQAEFSDGLMP